MEKCLEKLISQLVLLGQFLTVEKIMRMIKKINMTIMIMLKTFTQHSAKLKLLKLNEKCHFHVFSNLKSIF